LRCKSSEKQALKTVQRTYLHALLENAAKSISFAAKFPPNMDLQQKFEVAVADSKALSDRPSNETLLQLYSLFKQATEGDVNGEAPNMFDFVAKAKYEAWSALKGKTQDAAKEEYINLVQKLQN
jgi:diazepam-binding inhibitor (GABA receptor modulating acyl-CoA-binding protein)